MSSARELIVFDINKYAKEKYFNTVRVSTPLGTPQIGPLLSQFFLTNVRELIVFDASKQ